MKDRNNIRSIIYISLFWSFLISSITAVSTFSQNPDILLFQARFYLFLFCFFSNLLIFAGISTAVFIIKYRKTEL